MKLLKALLFLVATAAWPQGAPSSSDSPGSSDSKITGLRHAWYVVPTGADVVLTSDPWKLHIGVGLDQPHFGRDRNTGDLRPENDPYLKPLMPSAEVALFQTWSNDWFDAWVGPEAVGYRVWSGSASAFPDWTGNVFWALTGGLKRDRSSSNEHGLKSGYVAQATAEWSPSVFSLKGTDFYRAALSTSWYLPLWDLPGEAQLFSGLLALRADVQYTGGNQVPMVRLDPTEVRGYDGTFDARLLTVGSAELRVRLPSWWKSHDVVPVGFGFVDVGSYAGFADVSSGSARSGLLAGTGIGGGLELFGKVTPSLTLAFPLIGAPKSLWWDLSFQLAF